MMNTANFDQYGLLSHSVANPPHHHQTGQHHHQQQQQQSHHQHASGSFGISHSGNQAEDMFLARQNMFDSVSRLSVQMRHAAEMCDVFVKTVARQNPQVAAMMLAQPANITSGNPASASGAGSGVPTSFDFLNIANGAGGHTNVAGAASDAGTATSAQGTLTNGKKVKAITKAQQKRDKKLRDPDAPKRPPSAYLLFQNEVRNEIRKKHPGLPYAEVLGKVSEAWKALTDEQRKIYQDKTMENMAEWAQQKKDHEATLPSSGDMSA